MSLWPSEKGLILGIPRARTRQVRVTRLGDSCNDNTESTKEEGARPGRTSPLSRTHRTGYCIPEVSPVGVRVERTGKGGRRKSPPESEGGRKRRKGSLIRGQTDPGPRFPRDSFASQDSVVFKPERAARSRP